MKILIADDEMRLRKVLALYLRRCGHEVVEAENGREAVELAREKNPDVMIFDVMMPEMTGLEATKILKSDSAIKDKPIILLTANAAEKDHKLGNEAGANEYVTKPFSPKELMEIINKVTEK